MEDPITWVLIGTPKKGVIRCIYCGRFIGHGDNNTSKLTLITPDGNTDGGRTEYAHSECHYKER